MSPLLTITDLNAFYGMSQALFGISFDMQGGEAVALMGRNGMGKSTTIKSICGMMQNWNGSIVFDGHDLATISAHRAARLGLGLVPEGRRCFPNLTVYENCVAAARPGEWDFASVCQLFPRLKDRRNQMANTLSGGEQQMLAIARALTTNPKLLLLDEATEGLAPVVRTEIWNAIHALKKTGLSILLVDKSLKEVTGVADRCIILQNGVVEWFDVSSKLDVAKQGHLLGI